MLRPLPTRTAQTTVLVTHGIQHLPSADKVIVMDAGRIAHFGSFEEVRNAGAAFALAARAGTSNVEVKAQSTEIEKLDEMVVVEEEDEEMLWEKSKTPKWAAYKFFLRAIGPLATMIIALETLCLEATRAGMQYVQPGHLLFNHT